MKCLKIKLLQGTSLDSTLVILQELIQRYSYALERGFTLEFYKKASAEDADAPELILKTDHPLFLQACTRHFKDFVRFYIAPKSFTVPQGFERGNITSAIKNASVA